MAKITPYIKFAGNCREALKFYQQCLGGELNLQRISESPMAVRTPAGKAGQILHGSLISRNITILAADMKTETIIAGNNVQLCLDCESAQELESSFNNLSSEGAVITPLHQTFRGNSYGEFTDRFGVSWILNFTKH